MKLRADWNEFIKSLKRHGVRFLIVGAHALGVHGRPRYTQDLDVFVDASVANARRLSSALVDFGFANAARGWRRMTKPYQIMMLGAEARIDVLTSIGGVTFAQAWRGRRVIKDSVLGNVAVIGLAEFKINKQATGRTKDLLDLALLEEMELANKPTRVASRSRRTHRKPGVARSRTRGTAKRRG